ncbi:hypothetical protein [Arhodomonas sp. AD133]|uniref:hypothetical protein n=1 Tax=Arhodomonas sp. AD133 TaxID=3415009 RepID=UPI003EBFDC81
MTSDTILTATGRWRLLGRDGHLRSIPPYGRVDRSVRVITDFEDAHIGVLRFEGKPQYARAIIERHVRDAGWVEGPSHVIIHRLNRHHGGGQAFFTAVTLAVWQRTLDWARLQRRHCLILPLGALLAGPGGPRARILHLGPRLRCFADTDQGMRFEDVFAGGGGTDAQRRAARTLGTSLAALKPAGNDTAATFPHIEWLAADTDSPAREEALADEVRAVAGATVTVSAARPFRDPEGSHGDDGIHSALPAHVERLGAGAAVNPIVERIAWWSEAWAMPVVAGVAALALGLAVAGHYARTLADDEVARARALDDRIAQRESALEAARRPDADDRLRRVSEFVTALARGIAYSPAVVLRDVRDAAAPPLAIHRVRIKRDRQGRYHLRVDGIDRSRDASAAVRAFLTALRRRGWQSQPLEPASSAPGSFSYRLTRQEREA